MLSQPATLSVNFVSIMARVIAFIAGSVKTLFSCCYAAVQIVRSRRIACWQNSWQKAG